jgi:hypothetical protein
MKRFGPGKEVQCVKEANTLYDLNLFFFSLLMLFVELNCQRKSLLYKVRDLSFQLFESNFHPTIPILFLFFVFFFPFPFPFPFREIISRNLLVVQLPIIFVCRHISK